MNVNYTQIISDTVQDFINKNNQLIIDVNEAFIVPNETNEKISEAFRIRINKHLNVYNNQYPHDYLETFISVIYAKTLSMLETSIILYGVFSADDCELSNKENLLKSLDRQFNIYEFDKFDVTTEKPLYIVNSVNDKFEIKPNTELIDEISNRLNSDVETELNVLDNKSMWPADIGILCKYLCDDLYSSILLDALSIYVYNAIGKAIHTNLMTK